MSASVDDVAPAASDVTAPPAAASNDTTTPPPTSDLQLQLQDLNDVECVLSALAIITDGLPGAAANLGRFLDDHLAQGRFTAAGHTTPEISAAVQTAQDALSQVKNATEHLVTLLARAETTILALTPDLNDDSSDAA